MNKMKQFAVVTGGTSGIGYELAKCCAQDGYNLLLVARNQDDLERVAQEFTREYAVTVLTIAKDLFEPENAFSLYDEIAAKNIEVDILINDAGQGLYGEFVGTDIRRELNIINLNICSLVILTKLFLRDMLAQRNGKILNLSSIASRIPGPWQAVYHGTKAFVQSFTESVRSEVKDKGITVTALLPGATATDFFNKADMLESKMVQENELDNPEKVARDGYEALMKGDDMVVSGWKNKLQVGLNNLTPDEQMADRMKKKMEPVSEKH